MSGGSGKVARIFLVDDHEVIRRALATWIERSDDLELAGEASDVAAALGGIAETQPDVAVVDLQLGNESGISICEKIRTEHRDVKSLILTGMQDQRYLMDVIASGASGYVSKVAPMNEILDAIRAVVAGKTAFTVAATAPPGRDHSEPDEPQLSEQEQRILDLLSAGLTNSQIARRLGIADQTVKNHVSKLLSKLGLRSRTQAAIYAAERRSGEKL